MLLEAWRAGSCGARCEETGFCGLALPPGNSVLTWFSSSVNHRSLTGDALLCPGDSGGSNNDPTPLTDEHTRQRGFVFLCLFFPLPFLHMPQIMLICQLISSHPQLQSSPKLGKLHASLVTAAAATLPKPHPSLRHEASLLATICLGQRSPDVSFHQKLLPICTVLAH